MGNRSWVSAHIFYHDSLDDLINGGIRPLVGELNSLGMIDRYFFVRYWQGGPHVRLRLLPAFGMSWETVTKLIDKRIGRFFSLHPSNTILRRDQYEEVAYFLSRVEHGEQSVGTVYPNNSLRYIPYAPEYTLYGGMESTEAVEHHFADSSELALELIASVPNRDRRYGEALSMMLAAAAVCERELENLARFFMVGDQAWGTRFIADDRDRYENQFERQYLRQRPRLLNLVRRLLSMVEQEVKRSHDSTLVCWTDSIVTLNERLVRLERHELSRYGGIVRNTLCPDKQPHRNAIILYCSHLNNNRLGISLHEEAYLVYLIRRTLAEILEGR